MQNYHTVGIDLFELWLVTIIAILVIIFAFATSIHEEHTDRNFAITEGVVFGTAVIVTIGLLIGFIGVW